MSPFLTSRSVREKWPLDGVVVTEVGTSVAPVNLEFALASAILDTVEVHVNRLRLFMLDNIFANLTTVVLYTCMGVGVGDV